MSIPTWITEGKAQADARREENKAHQLRSARLWLRSVVPDAVLEKLVLDYDPSGDESRLWYQDTPVYLVEPETDARVQVRVEQCMNVTRTRTNTCFVLTTLAGGREEFVVNEWVRKVDSFDVPARTAKIATLFHGEIARLLGEGRAEHENTKGWTQ